MRYGRPMNTMVPPSMDFGSGFALRPLLLRFLVQTSLKLSKMAGRGKVLRWIRSRNFGFLEDDDVPGDVFIHQKDIVTAKEDDIVVLKPGMRVQYELDPNAEKPKATQLRCEDGSLVKPVKMPYVHKRGRGKIDRSPGQTDLVTMCKVMADTMVNSLIRACPPSQGQGLLHPLPSFSAVNPEQIPVTTPGSNATEDPFVPLPGGGKIRWSQLLALEPKAQQSLLQSGSDSISNLGPTLSANVLFMRPGARISVRISAKRIRLQRKTYFYVIRIYIYIYI